MLIRLEEEKDWKAVYELNKSAFESDAEAKLVDALRTATNPYISLVSEIDSNIVGHILFTSVLLSGHQDLKIMGLAPMAVLPEHQKKGIGSELVNSGLKSCISLGFGAVVVLGHPTYYPRFGFFPSTRYSIRSEYDAPKDVFMVLELEVGFLRG